MNKDTRKRLMDGGVIVLMFVLLITLVNPFDWFMFSRVQMIVLAVFACLFALFIAAFWNEQPEDERDSLHMMFAGRVAYLVGTTVTAIAIIVECIQHHVSWWPPLILFSMIFSKYMARVYAQRRK